MADSNSTPLVRPCPKCGTADRYADGRCRQCCKEGCKAYHAANKEQAKANNAAWRSANKEKCNADSKAWTAANREKSRAIKAKWAKANPDKVRAKNVAYYKNNTEMLLAKAKKWEQENRDKANASDAAWRANNPDRYKAAYTARRKANPEKSRDAERLWRQKNPEAVRMRDHSRRLVGKKSSNVAKGLIKKLVKLQRGLCPCCSLPLGDDFHMDHIIPLALGGSVDASNIQLMRATCNQQKSAKHPVDFMQSRGFLL